MPLIHNFEYVNSSGPNNDYVQYNASARLPTYSYITFSPQSSSDIQKHTSLDQFICHGDVDFKHDLCCIVPICFVSKWASKMKNKRRGSASVAEFHVIKRKKRVKMTEKRASSLQMNS